MPNQPSNRKRHVLAKILRVMPIVVALGVSTWNLFLYARHDGELKDLEIKQRRFDNKHREEGRFSISEKFSIVRYSPKIEFHDLYIARFEVELKNTSEAPLKISASVVDVWRGRIAGAPSENAALGYNKPPARWGSAEKGAIDWILVNTSAYIYDQASTGDIPSGIEAVIGGGGISKLSDGERSYYAAEFLVKASDEDSIGVTYSFVVEGGSDRFWRVIKTLRVSQAEPIQESQPKQSEVLKDEF